MTAEESQGADSLSSLRCTACTARLAHDQRYCVECGTRRDPLLRWIAEMIGTIREQGRRPVAASGAQAKPAAALGARRTILGIPMPDPRAIAVAVMGMLSFGVIVGSIASPTIADLATAPILLILPRQALPSQPAADQSSSTIVQTVTVGGGTSGSAGGATPAGAAQAQPTTTVYAPTSPGSGSSPGSLLGLPPIKHVFLIVLSDKGFSQTFAPTSQDHYLSRTLTRQGKLIQYYYAVAPSPLANAIALISGQGPTQQTAADCPRFSLLTPAAKHAEGQVIGSGCVYPSRTQTLADQLSAKHLAWRAYVQSIGKAGHGQQTCRHPSIGSTDRNQSPRPGDPYVTWTNPFVYFLSLSKGGACNKYDVSLDKLANDLKAARTAASFAYIVPSPCDDGSEQPCAPHARSGLASADVFLKSVVPEIEHSAAYRDHGLIAITFDQAPQTGPYADASACCSNPTYPNLAGKPGTGGTTTTPTSTTPTSTTPTTTTQAGTPTTPIPTTTTATSTGTGQTTPTGGGGQVGLLLISSYVKPGTTDVIDYDNHFSLLASIENIFGLGRLGYASDLSLPVFDAAVFNGHP